jgi:hypothetical protein
MGLRDKLRNLRDTAEERIDRTKQRIIESNERRDIAREADASMRRGGVQKREYDKYSRGEISKELYDKRTARAEREYESSRVPLDKKTVQVTERIISGSAKAVAAFQEDIEHTARPPSKKSKRGAPRQSSSDSGGGGGYGGINFGSLNSGMFSGGGGSSNGIDFSNMSIFGNNAPPRRQPRKKPRR